MIEELLDSIIVLASLTSTDDTDNDLLAVVCTLVVLDDGALTDCFMSAVLDVADSGVVLMTTFSMHDSVLDCSTRFAFGTASGTEGFSIFLMAEAEDALRVNDRSMGTIDEESGFGFSSDFLSISE